eukprot:TRINITY_DN1472_c1_g2_i1.p1 TRINITY_DN1472_c1_g2~~TRINITY_DN1472_c1_g2_i1.p1  ORF type:complete len:444 (+),score=123.65 TRINITY_DN1472_c1_g2_i1:459-1790(+)
MAEMEAAEKAAEDATKDDADESDEDDLRAKAKADKKKRKEDKKKKKEDKKKKKEDKKERKEEKEKKDAKRKMDNLESVEAESDTERVPIEKPTAKKPKTESLSAQEERRRLESGKKSIRTDKLMEMNEDLENAIITGCLSRQRDILSELAFYGPRLDQLKDVGIGKTVVKLINTPLQPLAKVLIQMWKTLIHEPSNKARKPTFTQMPSQTSLQSQTEADTQEINIPTQSTVDTQGSSAAEEPSQESQTTLSEIDVNGKTEVTIQKRPEGDYRTGMHAKLVNAFKTKDPEGKSIPLASESLLLDYLAHEIVNQLEISYPLDPETGKRTQQMTKYRQILTNLEDPKNADFRHRVLSKPSPYYLVNTMSVTDMANPEKRKERKDTTEYMRDAMRTDFTKPAVTDQFRCGRCNQNKTTYFQMQTRSADEPMTTFVTCVNCGNAWKFC